jgi:hypothetical protein
MASSEGQLSMGLVAPPYELPFYNDRKPDLILM